MSNTFTPGPTPNTMRAANGRIVTIPDGWVLVPPGGAALSRRIKAAGDHYVVAEKKAGRSSPGDSGLRRRPSSAFVQNSKPSDWQFLLATSSAAFSQLKS